MTDDLLLGDNRVSRPRRRPRPGSLMIASIACIAFGSLLVAFFTIDIGLVLKERHIWPSSRLSERLIRAFFLGSCGRILGGRWARLLACSARPRGDPTEHGRGHYRRPLRFPVRQARPLVTSSPGSRTGTLAETGHHKDNPSLFRSWLIGQPE